MRKILTVLVGLFLAFSLASCNNGEKDKEAMSYKEFMEAQEGDEVVVEGFIAAKQGWWNGKVTMYLITDVQGEGFFIYNFECTADENENVYTIGQYVHIEATKSIYAEEHEILGENVSLAKVTTTNKFIASSPINLTNKLDELENYQNSFFSMTLTVKKYETEDPNTGISSTGAYGFKGDNPSDDLYFTLTNGSVDIDCCIEVYLTGVESKVYNDVKNLVVGASVTVQGYLYWYNGANPHIISVKPEVLTYSEFMEVAEGDIVTVEGTIAAKQAWWNGAVSLYLTTDVPGQGYFIYNAICTIEESENELAVGNFARFIGEKMIYAGEHELSDAKYQSVETNPTPPKVIDLTNHLNDLTPYRNGYFSMTLTVKEYVAPDDNTSVAESKAYGYEGSTLGKDLYFTLTNGTVDINCVIESYLTDSTTDVYAIVQTLVVGETITVTGFLYWWNGPNPHIIKIVKAGN